MGNIELQRCQPRRAFDFGARLRLKTRPQHTGQPKISRAGKRLNSRRYGSSVASPRLMTPAPGCAHSHSLTQPVCYLAPGPASPGLAMRRQPPESPNADRQRANSLLDALPLFPDDKAEARSIDVNILPHLSANPFGGPSWLSAFHLCCLGFRGSSAWLWPYESKSASFHQELSPGQKWRLGQFLSMLSCQH